jgi:hypothetical protein
MAHRHSHYDPTEDADELLMHLHELTEQKQLQWQVRDADDPGFEVAHARWGDLHLRLRLGDPERHIVRRLGVRRSRIGRIHWLRLSPRELRPLAEEVARQHRQREYMRGRTPQVLWTAGR